jgi:hypothetical protein
VLKGTGSLYLHCDTTASHYLKIVLDAVFGPQNFRNEIIWKRTSSHNDARRRYGDVSDSLLFYTKGERYTFNVQQTSSEEGLRILALIVAGKAGEMRDRDVVEREHGYVTTVHPSPCRAAFEAPSRPAHG